MRSSNRAAPLLLLSSLYIAQGLPYGFFTQALPVLMRENGASLKAISATSLLFLPWALKFLWAPMVDHVGTPARLDPADPVHRRRWRCGAGADRPGAGLSRGVRRGVPLQRAGSDPGRGHRRPRRAPARCPHPWPWQRHSGRCLSHRHGAGWRAAAVDLCALRLGADVSRHGGTAGTDLPAGADAAHGRRDDAARGATTDPAAGRRLVAKAAAARHGAAAGAGLRLQVRRFDDCVAGRADAQGCAVADRRDRHRQGHARVDHESGRRSGRRLAGVPSGAPAGAARLRHRAGLEPARCMSPPR